MMRRIFDEEVDFIKALCKDESHCYEISMAKLYLYVELHVKKVERLLAKTQKTQEISEIADSSALAAKGKEVKDNIPKSETQKEVNVQPEGPSLEECETLLNRQGKKARLTKPWVHLNCAKMGCLMKSVRDSSEWKNWLRQKKG